METREYSIRGDPEQMFRALVAGLPSAATVTGNSSRGAIDAVGTRLVDFFRTGNQLTVTVRRGIFLYTEAAIWQKIESALRPYL
ncbi:MAG: hypothetical protein L3K23_02150 [Thermoplasmata archaeon]|nr:hypothetical protein [Thermoplasmata archaeon]